MIGFRRGASLENWFSVEVSIGLDNVIVVFIDGNTTAVDVIVGVIVTETRTGGRS